MTTVAMQGIDAVRGRPRSHARERTVARWGWLACLATIGVWAASVVLPFPAALAMLALGAAAAAGLGLRYPVLGLLGIGLLCALDSIVGPLLLTGGLLRWNTLNYWLVGVAFLFVPLLLRERGLPALCFALLLAWMGLGLFLSPDRAAGMAHMSGLLVLLGLVVYFRRATRVPEAWYWMAVTVSLAGALGTLAFLSSYPMVQRINPNVWSDLPLAGIHAACIALALEHRRRRQVVLGALTTVNLAWVFLSGSRGALLIALVAIIAILGMAGSRRRAGVLLAVGALIAAAIVASFPDLAQRSVARLALTVDDTRSIKVRTSSRSEIARGGWELFRTHPLLGVGTGGFVRERAALGRVGTTFYRPGVGRSAHSGWVKVLAENGAAGALLLAAYVASFALVGRKLPDRRMRLLAWTASATLLLGFIATEFQSKELWFFAAGCTVLVTVPAGSRKRAP